MNPIKNILKEASTEIGCDIETMEVMPDHVHLFLKGLHLAQAISDVSWGMFLNMLAYKCDNLVKIDRWFASSQTCSHCGYINKDTKNLNVREWICPECGEHHNRDVNAAINIEREGLSLCGLKVSDYTMLAPRTQLLQ